VDFKQAVQHIHYGFQVETIAKYFMRVVGSGAISPVDGMACGCRFAKFAGSKTAERIPHPEWAAYNTSI
jgi:hypothetical protein